MKKIFKVSLAIFAVASMALAASTVMMADSVIIGGKGDADDSEYCLFQSMGDCPHKPMNYICKVSYTAEHCRRHLCCQNY